jgi:hypothetical protein
MSINMFVGCLDDVEIAIFLAEAGACHRCHFGLPVLGARVKAKKLWRINE